MTFERFMVLVNIELNKLCMMSTDDIDDFGYADAWRAKRTPKAVAAAAYRAAKRNNGM